MAETFVSLYFESYVVLIYLGAKDNSSQFMRKENIIILGSIHRDLSKMIVDAQLTRYPLGADLIRKLDNV